MCAHAHVHMCTVSQEPSLWTMASFSDRLPIKPFLLVLPTKYKLKTTKQNKHLPFLCLNFCFELLHTWVCHRYQVKMPQTELAIFPLPSKSVKIPLLLRLASKCFVSTIRQASTHLFLYRIPYPSSPSALAWPPARCILGPFPDPSPPLSGLKQ